jgi:transcription elongation factor GreA
MAEVELSRTAYDRLKEELEDLTTRGRVEVAGLIEKARAMGDLSENGDYHAAKDQQGKMEARVRQIEAMLKNAKIIEVEDKDVVGTGLIVTIRYEGDSDTETFLLGNIEERPEGVDVISPGSPLGQSLTGHSVGEVVEYDAPNGKLRVEIVGIKAP